MATPKVYVICDQNCKFEGMTKEQILTAIAQAVNEGTIGDIDTGFITTIKTINGLPLRFFLGEQSAYEALTDEEKEGLFAVITNDTTTEGINKAISDLQNDVKELKKGLITGAFEVGKAKAADELKLTYETSETDFKSIGGTGIYVIDIDNVSDQNIHLTCVIMITDITKKAYSTISKKMGDDSTSGTHYCQVVMYPQAASEGGEAYGVLQVEHDSAYDWEYKISKVTRIGG